MMKMFLMALLIGLLLFLSLFIYAACVAAGHEDRMREDMYEQWKREHAISAETEG